MSTRWAIAVGLTALNIQSGCGPRCDGVQRYQDADRDGFGDSFTPLDRCDTTSEGVINARDCDDTKPEVFPDAVEVCNRVDDDCNGRIDDGIEGLAPPAYLDVDRDGHGVGDPWEGCEAPPPLYTAPQPGDCDDLSPSTYPGATELCDGTDTNCDGLTDNGTADSKQWFLDSDADGYGAPYPSYYGCMPTFEDFPEGYSFQADANIVDNGLDCEDFNALTSPDGIEVCDSIDNDCDGSVDEGVVSGLHGWIDRDEDGFGGEERFTACQVDLFLQVPGAGLVFVSSIGGDCDDVDDEVNPFAPEICNGIDDNCNGAIDMADVLLDQSSTLVWFGDVDGDGFGDPNNVLFRCDPPPNSVLDDSDCDDNDEDVNPNADEVCNTIDDDCDDRIDNNDPTLIGGPCP